MVERSHFFEDLAHAEDDPLAFRAEHEPCLARLRARLGDVRGRRIFEPGCGAGPLTVRLAEWVGGGGHVLALDASERMIARCAAAVAGLPQVTVRHGDITGYSAPAGRGTSCWFFVSIRTCLIRRRFCANVGTG